MKLILDGRMVGEVIDDTFETIRKPEHYMRKYRGYGISEGVLTKLQELGIEKIRLTYLGVRGTKRFVTTVTKFRHSNNVWMDTTSTGGIDRQFFLSESELTEVTR